MSMDPNPADIIEVSAREELYEIAEKLRIADTNEKRAKKAKENVRPAFFDLITEVVEEEIPLANEIVTLDTEDLPLPDQPLEARLLAWQRKHWPTYVLVQWATTPPQHVEVLLIEDAQVVKFQFVHDGFKYGRTSYLDGGGLDVDSLREELNKPEATMTEAEIALAGSIQAKVTYEVDEGLMRDALTEYPELVDLVQRFIDPGTPKVKLLPITKAKEE